jgi:hypothetical protein
LQSVGQELDNLKKLKKKNEVLEMMGDAEMMMNAESLE